MEFVLEGTPRVPGAAVDRLSPLLPHERRRPWKARLRPSPEPDWKALADELARALRATILRNPTVNSHDWDRARTALERYETAGGQTGTVPAAELPRNPRADFGPRTACLMSRYHGHETWRSRDG